MRNVLLVPLAFLCYNTSMRSSAWGMICLLILSGAGTVRAESNPDLISRLQTVLTLEMKTKRQCSTHSEQFQSTVAYFDVVAEKEDLVAALQEVFQDIGGELLTLRSPVESYPTAEQALTSDARNELEIIRACDNLLEKYGHPKVRQLVQKAKDTATQHYMALTNSALSLLVNEQVKRQPPAPP